MSRPNRSLYIRNVPEEARAEEMRTIFGKYGHIRDVYVPMDYFTRRPRGFAYIEYEDLHDAENALRSLDRYHYRGRDLEIEFAQGDRKTPHEMRRKYGAPAPRSMSPRHRSSRRRSRSRSRSRKRSRRHRSRSRSRSRSRRRSRSRSRSPHRSRSSRDRKSGKRSHRSRSRSGSRRHRHRKEKEYVKSRSRTESEARNDLDDLEDVEVADEVSGSGSIRSNGENGAGGDSE